MIKLNEKIAVKFKEIMSEFKKFIELNIGNVKLFEALNNDFYQRKYLKYKIKYLKQKIYKVFIYYGYNF